MKTIRSILLQLAFALFASTWSVAAQGTLTWYTTKSAAMAAAQKEGKRVLLVSGRDTCGNTLATRYSSMEDDSIKSLLEKEFVLWYDDCDTQGEFWTYASGLGSFMLPVVCVIDPSDPDSYLVRSTGYLDVDDLSSLIQSVPAPLVIQKATYTVVFKANGGNGKTSSQKMSVGKKAKLRKNGFSRNGYVFLGWGKSKNGAVAYKDRASVKNLAAAGKKATLYAQWAKKTYKVKFHPNGGKGKMDVQTMTYGKAKKLSANKFKRKGYVFKGWAKSEAGAKKCKIAYKNKDVVKNLLKNGKTVNLYAVWKWQKKTASETEWIDLRCE